MASLITAAARARASGNALGALNWIALRDDAPALALRGIAMARLGPFTRQAVIEPSYARGNGSVSIFAGNETLQNCALTRSITVGRLRPSGAAHDSVWIVFEYLPS